jgi:hypothetical protein
LYWPPPLEVAELPQRPARDGDDRLAGWREGGEPLPLPEEDAHADLVLELPDLLADARLRGVQRGGGVRDVEAVIDDGAQIAELLEVHEALAGVRLESFAQARALSRLLSPEL